ncbi:MAG: HNH endonuclease [Sphingomicrobium sp.]|jgi:5-methylcytosine-specific restriction endonuclease McrA
MSRIMIARYVNPWKYKREQAEAERMSALRARDGDNCARCRRPMRFDLPAGYDQGAAVEEVVPNADGSAEDLGNLRLCHRRCNASGVDHTDEVSERMRRRNEAALFANHRKRA